MHYTDDPVADYNKHDKQHEIWLRTLPICAECGEPIQDEECYEINGEFICPECLKDNHRRWTEDVL